MLTLREKEMHHKSLAPKHPVHLSSLDTGSSMKNAHVPDPGFKLPRGPVEPQPAELEPPWWCKASPKPIGFNVNVFNVLDDRSNISLEKNPHVHKYTIDVYVNELLLYL